MMDSNKDGHLSWEELHAVNPKKFQKLFPELSEEVLDEVVNNDDPDIRNFKRQYERDEL